MMTEMSRLSLTDAREAIRAGEMCPVDYTEALLSHIERHNAITHAFIEVVGEQALARARQLRDTRPAGEAPPLYGIPFAVKDIIDVEGSVTTCQSKAGYTRPAKTTAQCVARLSEAGGIYLGKLTLYEFALGGPNFEDPWPPAHNPWNPDYTPGSSSSGSGAAVAAGMVPLAIATDTGGSIRSPAIMNGVAGLKPTFGRIDTDGLFPLAPSMDTLGPITRTVRDLALPFACMTGEPEPSCEAAAPRVGHIEHFWRDDLTPSADVERMVLAAVHDIEGAGATVVERRVSALNDFNAVGWSVLFAEAFDIHAEALARHPDLFATPVRDMLLTGAFLTAADIIRATRVRQRLTAEIDHALTDVDVLLTAGSALPPCRLDDSDALAALAKAAIRIPANVTGHPAIAFPAGLSDDGVPMGLQVIGHKGDETTLIAAAAWIASHLSGWPADMLPPVVERMTPEVRSV